MLFSSQGFSAFAVLFKGTDVTTHHRAQVFGLPTGSYILGFSLPQLPLTYTGLYSFWGRCLLGPADHVAWVVALRWSSTSSPTTFLPLLLFSSPRLGLFLLLVLLFGLGLPPVLQPSRALPHLVSFWQVLGFLQFTGFQCACGAPLRVIKLPSFAYKLRSVRGHTPVLVASLPCCH